MKEILDTWENLKFSVVKYCKGTQERGYILGSVDEIVQCLDDNTFNLQSISGSRFVGPFLETVHKWEKTLSLIGEVIEVREETKGRWLRADFEWARAFTTGGLDAVWMLVTGVLMVGSLHHIKVTI